MSSNLRKYLPIGVAIIVALVVAGWYMISGRSSLDLSARLTQQAENVEEVDTTDPNTVLVTCKNGEKYEIVFTEDQSNYDRLVFNACGPEGAAN